MAFVLGISFYSHHRISSVPHSAILITHVAKIEIRNYGHSNAETDSNHKGKAIKATKYK